MIALPPTSLTIFILVLTCLHILNRFCKISPIFDRIVLCVEYKRLCPLKTMDVLPILISRHITGFCYVLPVLILAQSQWFPVIVFLERLWSASFIIHFIFAVHVSSLFWLIHYNNTKQNTKRETWCGFVLWAIMCLQRLRKMAITSSRVHCSRDTRWKWKLQWIRPLA